MLPTTALARATTTAGGKGNRLFVAFCPDGSGPEVLPARLRVRAAHFERAERDKKEGILEFGRGFLPPPSSALHSHPALAAGQESMAGSVMFFRLPSLEAAWRRVREDVYWTEGVWDREKVRVETFLSVPGE